MKKQREWLSKMADAEDRCESVAAGCPDPSPSALATGLTQWCGEFAPGTKAAAAIEALGLNSESLVADLRAGAEAIPPLVAACRDFMHNCPACGGKGNMPTYQYGNGDLSPGGLCVWCAKFRAVLA